MSTADFRVGFGYDSHRLVPSAGSGAIGRPLVIGGVLFRSEVGPRAHSDGDALMHAITDAVLGAAGLPDIGELFPDQDPRWKGAKSEVFLAEACRLAGERGWGIGNVDATVVVERPKLGPRKEEVRQNLARILRVDPAVVNVKGKTHELDGRTDDLIEAMAVVGMVRVRG